MLANYVDEMRAKNSRFLPAFEKFLFQTHYKTDYGKNIRNEGPKCAAGLSFRHLYNAVDARRHNNSGFAETVFADSFNDAPTLAFNRLLGGPFYRSKMEAILARAVALGTNPGRALVDYLMHGGLSEHGFTGGSRIPYLGADFRVHALAMTPVGQLAPNMLSLMATDPYHFNILLAAEASCRNAIVRVDTMHFLDERFAKLRPRITSNLLSVKRQTRREKPEAEPTITYLVSINGGRWLNPFLEADWESVANLMEQADYAQIYVPTDYVRHEMLQAYHRDLRDEARSKVKFSAQQKPKKRSFMTEEGV